MKNHTNKIFLLALVGIFLLALLLRIVFLDRVLSGILNDELKFVFNAKAVWLTGTSAYGGWNPFSLNGDPHGFYDNEIIPLLMSPFVGVLPYTLFFVRLPFALISFLDVVLLYFIGKKLFGRYGAIIVAAVAAINPYLILVGRVATEPQIAMFFFLLGLCFLLYFRGWRILLSFVPFFLAFYSYVGTKVTFLPFVFVTTLWSAAMYNKKYVKQYAVVFFFALLLMLAFVVKLHSQTVAGRLEELLLPNSQVVVSAVDSDRKESLVSPFTPVFVNKVTTISFLFLRNYIDSFNLRILFVTGEVSAQLSMWNIGYFYLLDFIPLVYGLFLLAKKNKKTLLLLLGMLFVAPIAGALRSDPGGSYVNHGILIYPTLILLIGYGLSELLLSLWNSKKIAAVVILCLYAYSFSYFTYTYFLRMPVYNAEGPWFSRRILAKYISFEKTKSSHVYVYAYDPFNTFLSYVLYASAYNTKQDALAIRKILHSGEKTGVYSLGNVVFTHENSPLSALITANDAVIFGNTVKGNFAPFWMNIPDLSSGGSVYKIYNGKTCSATVLKRYPEKIQFASLSVESLSEKSLCDTLITRY